MLLSLRFAPPPSPGIMTLGKFAVVKRIQRLHIALGKSGNDILPSSLSLAKTTVPNHANIERRRSTSIRILTTSGRRARIKLSSLIVFSDAITNSTSRRKGLTDKVVGKAEGKKVRAKRRAAMREARERGVRI